MSIEVVEYDPSWQDRFEKVAAALSDALADGPAASVEHVGSTAVSGLAADPAMDIDTYLARKSDVLQKILAASDLTDAERRQILSLNDPSR